MACSAMIQEAVRLTDLHPAPIPPLAQALSHLWRSISMRSCAEISDRRSAVVITTSRQPDADAAKASE